MKIDYAIMGSNLNPMYLDFWPIISKVWKKVFNITPVLGLICEEDSEFFEDENGIVKKFKKIEGIDSGLQSQIIRLFLTKELKGNIIISDIDMVPLSKEYFIEQIKFFDENKIYVMSSDNTECNQNKEIPMCYNVSNSELFSKMLEINEDWVNFTHRLKNMGFGWTTDQNYLWLKMQKFSQENPENVVLLSRGWGLGANGRIDRISWKYDENLVRSGKYIDSHLLRPYKENKLEVDKLINLLW
jgi:hypothetical protein